MMGSNLRFTQGARVRIDSDDPEWGRICENGVIAATPSKRARYVLVDVEGIWARRRVLKEDVVLLDAEER